VVDTVAAGATRIVDDAGLVRLRAPTEVAAPVIVNVLPVVAADVQELTMIALYDKSEVIPRVAGTLNVPTYRDAEPVVSVLAFAVSPAVTAISIERFLAPKIFVRSVSEFESVIRTPTTPAAAAELTFNACDVEVDGAVDVVALLIETEPLFPMTGVAATAVPAGFLNPVT
jgi:hypothetical protein